MGLIKNAIDAALIAAAFFAFGALTGFIGWDVVLPTTFLPITGIVAYFLAFMETTYSRF